MKKGKRLKKKHKIKNIFITITILHTILNIFGTIYIINKSKDKNIETIECSIEENVYEENLNNDIIKDEIVENENLEINKVENNILTGYRITSYYPGNNGTSRTTGSGKTTDNFTLMNINGKSVYSYDGKIVVAGATKELLKSGYSKNGSQNIQNKHYFKYYDTGKLKINDIWYDFIVLDSCGASMWEGYYRIDIFVPSKNNIIDINNIELTYD